MLKKKKKKATIVFLRGRTILQLASGRGAVAIIRQKRRRSKTAFRGEGGKGESTGTQKKKRGLEIGPSPAETGKDLLYTCKENQSSHPFLLKKSSFQEIAKDGKKKGKGGDGRRN